MARPAVTLFLFILWFLSCCSVHIVHNYADLDHLDRFGLPPDSKEKGVSSKRNKPPDPKQGDCLLLS